MAQKETDMRPKIEGITPSQSAFVVGGASGIGRETARHFLMRGVNTTIIDADSGQIAAAQEALQGSRGRLTTFTADVRDRTRIAQVFAEGAALQGGLDFLVYTAGVLRPSRLAEMSEFCYDLTFDVNAKGFWNCVQAALPYFPETGGAIVAVSSASGSRPKAGNGAYAASKVALQFLVRTFALELASRQLRVNCVAPSTVRTPMTARLDEKSESSGFQPSPTPPLGRLCKTEDVARAIVFLCSEDAGFITGAILAVDGALTAGVALRGN